MPHSESAPVDGPTGRDGSTEGAPVEPRDPPEVLAAVRRVQQGDTAAFAVIHHTYGRPLKQFFLNRRVPEAIADELYQETLFKAWEQIHQFRFDGPFAAWLQRIGENLWKNDRRAWQTQKRNRVLVLLDHEAGSGEWPLDEPLFGEPPPSPEAQAEHAEQVRQLARAMAQLPPGQRRSIQLRYGHQLKYREVAELLGVSTGSVQSQVFEGTHRLRLLMQTPPGAGDDSR